VARIGERVTIFLRMRAVAVSLVVVAAAWSAGCSGGGGGPSKVGGQPSWRQGTQLRASVSPTRGGPVVFAPDSTASSTYGDPATAAPTTELGRSIEAAVALAAKQANLPAPVADGRLFTAAEELAAVVPDEGVIAYSLVEFALQRQGIIEPSPHLLVVWGPLDDPAVLVEQLAPRIPELLAAGATARLGIGAARRAGNEGVVVFALQGSAVEIKPVPRAFPDGGVIKLSGRVLAPFKDPEVFVTHENGAVSRLPSAGKTPAEFAAQVDCASRVGRQQIEVTANDATGSTVLANFPVWCNEAAPASISVDTTIDDGEITDAADAEQRLLGLVNRDRAAAGLSALVWDDAVAEVARAHSREMRATGVVAHVSPQTGTAADRVRVAGIKTAAVLENVARAYGVGEAHVGLMNSPGHRANLMSAVATHIGVGVVLGDDVAGRRELFVTQVFIRVPPRIDPAAAAQAIHAKLDGVRRVDTDAVLESAAQKVADKLAAGVPRDKAWAESKRTLEGLAGKYRRIGSVQTAVADLDAITGDALLGGYAPDLVGVGAAQGSHPEIGDGAIYIVLLLGEKR
jgi:uncharacterized protein YkwD